MSGDKIKTGTNAGLLAWCLSLIGFGLGIGWIYSSWGKAAEFAWQESGTFKLRLFAWFLIQIPCTIIGGIALHRQLKTKFGKNVEDIRKENMVLKEKS